MRPYTYNGIRHVPVAINQDTALQEKGGVDVQGGLKLPHETHFGGLRV